MMLLFARVVNRIRYGNYANTYEFRISKNFRNWDSLLKSLPKN